GRGRQPAWTPYDERGRFADRLHRSGNPFVPVRSAGDSRGGDPPADSGEQRCSPGPVAETAGEGRRPAGDGELGAPAGEHRRSPPPDQEPLAAVSGDRRGNRAPKRL